MGYGFLSGFLPFSFTETARGCLSLKKSKSQGKAVEVTVNNKEDTIQTLSGFRPRIQPLDAERRGGGRKGSFAFTCSPAPSPPNI